MDYTHIGNLLLSQYDGRRLENYVSEISQRPTIKNPLRPDMASQYSRGEGYEVALAVAEQYKQTEPHFRTYEEALNLNLQK